MYPNPAKNQFTIQLTIGIVLQKVVIYNALGQVVFQADNQNLIDVNHLEKGAYFVKVFTDKGYETLPLVLY